MKEYRPLNPPEEKELVTYVKCDSCEDKFESEKVLSVGWGNYCKHCSDTYVEDNIKEGDNEYTVAREMKEFKQAYLLTFGYNYK